MAHQDAAQVAQKGHPWHEHLPQHHQDPGIQGGWNEEEAKDASLCCSADVVVHHDQAKDESRRPDGTLVCQLCSESAGRSEMGQVMHCLLRRKLTERKAVQQVVQPCLTAMADLQSKSLAHGAIVPHNILFNSQEATCKLAGKTGITLPALSKHGQFCSFGFIAV